MIENISTIVIALIVTGAAAFLVRRWRDLFSELLGKKKDAPPTPRSDKSRNKSDNSRGSIELHSREISDAKPFDYRARWWKKLSRQYREQEKWRCQACNLSLHRHKYYLHTHHLRGTGYNEPKDLRVLCIGCHSEQPGENHYRLKETRDYRGFIKRYGKNWRRENDEDFARG